MLRQRHLPPPTLCDNCSKPHVKLVNNSQIYGQERGTWPYAYICLTCRAYVGCHQGTYNPLGKMAVPSIRRRRAKLHELFDIVWQEGWLTRFDAYRWLAIQLDIENINDCHIGELSKENLDKAILLMQSHSKTEYAMFKRRSKKAKVKKSEQRNRANVKIGLRKRSRPKKPEYSD